MMFWGLDLTAAARWIWCRVRRRVRFYGITVGRYGLGVLVYEPRKEKKRDTAC